jgi:hypothetical protein
VTYIYADVIDALESARTRGAPWAKIDPKESNEANVKRLLQLGDDASQENLKLHTFVLCECCTHDGKKNPEVRNE